MMLMLLAVPSVIALLLFVALVVSIVVRTIRGERWEVPLTELTPPEPQYVRVQHPLTTRVVRR